MALAYSLFPWGRITIICPKAKMASYVFMKILESAPQRYDRGINILSLGQIGKIRRDMRVGNRI